MSVAVAVSMSLVTADIAAATGGGEIMPSFSESLVTVPAPDSVRLVNVDADPAPEVVVSEIFQGTPWESGLRVFQLDASGSVVGPGVLYPTEHGWIVPSDVDGDGDLDIVLPTFQSGGAVTTRLNDGQAGFSSEVNSDVVISGQVTGGFAVRVNGDAVPDLLVTTRSLIYLFTGSGDGRFTLAGTTPIAEGTAYAASPALADVTGDGTADLVVPSDDTVRIFAGGAAGGFDLANPTVINNVCGVRCSPTKVAVADLNSDGRTDLVLHADVPGTTNDAAVVLLANADGAFTSTRYLTADNTSEPVLADVDADGLTDLVLSAGTLSGSANLVVHRGNGSGGLGAPILLPLSSPLHDLTAADLDHDGRTDLLGAHLRHTRTDTLATLHNTTASGPFAEPSVADLDFGAVKVGTSSAPRSVRVDNRGDQPLTVTATVTGQASGDFVIDASACSGIAVAPGAACSITVTFHPTVTGSRDATLEISSDGPYSPRPVDLSAAGVRPWAALPSEVDFGSTPPGTSVTRNVSLTAYNAYVSVESATVVATADHGDVNEFLAGSDTCSGRDIPVATSCSVSVKFRPQDRTGDLSAVLRIVDDTSTSPHDVLLSGVAGSPGVVLSATFLTFGETPVGTATSPQHLMVTNTGDAPLHFTPAANATEFVVDHDGVRLAVAPGATIDLAARFAPGQIGDRTATLSLLTNLPPPGSIIQVTLAGRGSTSPRPPSFSESLVTVPAPDSVRLVNVDADPAPEVVVSEIFQGTPWESGLRVFQLDASGSVVGPGVLYPTEHGWIVPSDVDGDGDLDIVLPTFQSGGAVTTRLNDGQAGFSSEVNSDVVISGQVTGGFAVRVNGDAVPDLLVTTRSLIYLFTGSGDGRFTLAGTTPIAEGTAYAASPALADVTGDGTADLVVPSDDTVRIFAGGAAGGFDLANPTVINNVCGVRCSPTKVAVADLNSDGRTDLVLHADVPGTTNDAAVVLLANADGAFTSTRYLTADNTSEPVLADVDADGLTDLVLSAGTLSGSANLVVHRGNGSGGLGAPILLPLSSPLHDLTAADLDHDGRTDLLGAHLRHTRTDTLATLHNTTILDSTPPQVAVTATPVSPDGTEGWYRSGVTVSVTATDADRVSQLEYRIDNGPWTAYAQPLTITDGEHVVDARASDPSGNVGTGTLKLRQDTVAPSVSLIGGPEGSIELGSVPAAPTCESSDSTSTVAACTVTGYGTGLGSHTLVATATDRAGNVSTMTREYTVLDTTAPAVEMLALPIVPDGDGDWYRSAVTVSISSSDLDRVAGVEYRIGSDAPVVDGGATLGDVWLAYTGPFTVDDGEHVVTGRATDPSGNVGTGTLTIRQDTVAPSVALVGGPDGTVEFGAVPAEPTCATSDATSGVASYMVTGYSTALGQHTLVATATDGAGNIARATREYTVADTTRPDVGLTVTPATPDGNEGWYRSRATVTVTATDIDRVTEIQYQAANGTWMPYTEPFSVSEGEQVVAARAADPSGNIGVATMTVRQDTVAPSVALVGGPEGAMVYGTVPPPPTCSAEDETSGLARCDVTGYSKSVGVHILVATATDHAGNTALVTRTYTVMPYTLRGFDPPVDMGVVNTAKAGRTIPIKFQVWQGTTELTDTSAVATITWAPTTTSPGVAFDEIEEITTSSAGLRYDPAAGMFIYNWRTPDAGTYRFTVTTSDGSTLVAIFTFR
jgi:hypothetical protein